MSEPIPFNKPYMVGTEAQYLQDAVKGGHLSGNGHFGAACARWLEDRLGTRRAFITPSCTAALEMTAMLADLGPGDEVVMPSYTFVSTANAVVLRGAVPVFADIDRSTLNLDPEAARRAITSRTRAVVLVHYAGIACDMDAFGALAEDYGLVLIEDAAQAIGSTWRGQALGTFGALGALSFHETKNIQCGEGGALLINDDRLVDRSEILQEKGTNRQRFFRGQVDKYTWVDIGSSYLLSEAAAAYLWAQLEHADEINGRRLDIWSAYYERFAELEHDGLLRRPVVPEHAEHNGHLFYVLLPDAQRRDDLLEALREHQVQGVFHYVPLHSSPAGRRHARAAGELPVTEDLSARLVRLPLWMGMDDAVVGRVVEAVTSAVRLGTSRTGSR